jgi:hypothetical protein
MSMTKVICSFLAGALCAIAVAAPKQPKKAHGPQASAMASKYATSAFDTSVTSLPLGYRSHDIAQFFGARTAAKGEFETTKEFETRRSIRDGTYAFQVEGVYPKYDADAEEYEITIYSHEPIYGYEDIDTDHLGFEVRDVVLSRRKYSASNSFGASTVVTSVTSKTYLVASRTTTSLEERAAGHTSPLLKIPVPRAEAPAFKKTFAVLIICKLDHDSLPEPLSDASGKLAGATGVLHAEATISQPTEVWSYQFAIRADIIGFWVYDTNSGKILAKFDAAGHPLSAGSAT